MFNKSNQLRFECLESRAMCNGDWAGAYASSSSFTNPPHPPKTTYVVYETTGPGAGTETHVESGVEYPIYSFS